LVVFANCAAEVCSKFSYVFLPTFVNGMFFFTDNFRASDGFLCFCVLKID